MEWSPPSTGSWRSWNLHRALEAMCHCRNQDCRAGTGDQDEDQEEDAYSKMQTMGVRLAEM